MDFHWLIDHPNQSSLYDSLHHSNSNSLQSSLLQLDHHHPIDPRLKTCYLPTATQSHSNQTLDPAHSQFLSHLSPQPTSPASDSPTKRAKLNSGHQKDTLYPPFKFQSPSFQNQTHLKDLGIENQIEDLMGHSLNSQLYSHGRNPFDLMLPKIVATTSIWSDQVMKIHYHTSTDQSFHQQTPSPSISTVPTSPSDQPSEILVQHQHSSPSSLIAEPSIDPSLEILHPSLSNPSFSCSLTSPCERASHFQFAEKDIQQNISKSTAHSPSSQISFNSTSSLKLSQIDVHGAGAGGGAAAVLEAVAAQQELKNPTTVTLHWNHDPLVKAKKQIRKRSIYKPNNQQNESNSYNQLDLKVTPMPISYNPDQFRSCNRIHWTKEEELLLLKEVEIHWHHYDCMAQIMKRHGPKGTISKTFSDRTAVSLKDKAVNISSRWYRDGTEISPIRRRAFARFRPKQLRGKPRIELPGMNEISNFLDPLKSSSSSTPLEDS